MDLLQWNLYKADTLSSNMNQVIRAVLTFLFFLRKDFVRTIKHQKSPKNTKKYKNATKQKRKTQISEQKLKMRLKNF